MTALYRRPDGRFDRTAYQREYMRQRREQQKKALAGGPLSQL